MSRATQVELLMAGLTDTSGEPLDGGLVYSYEGGTNTAKTLYTEQDKSAVATNPVVLDANGRALVFGDGGYKLVVKTSAGGLLYTYDNLVLGTQDLTNIWCGTSTGSANAYVLSPSPSVSEYVSGQQYSFIASFENTGAATANISALGAITIEDGAGNDLSAADFVVGGVYSLFYDPNGGSPRFVWAEGVNSPTYTNVTINSLTASKAVMSDASKVLVSTDSLPCEDLYFATEMTIGPNAAGASNNLIFRSSDVGSWVLDGSSILRPTVDATYDLGAATFAIKTIYANTINALTGAHYADFRQKQDPAPIEAIAGGPGGGWDLQELWDGVATDSFTQRTLYLLIAQLQKAGIVTIGTSGTDVMFRNW